VPHTLDCATPTSPPHRVPPTSHIPTMIVGMLHTAISHFPQTLRLRREPRLLSSQTSLPDTAHRHKNTPNALHISPTEMPHSPDSIGNYFAVIQLYGCAHAKMTIRRIRTICGGTCFFYQNFVFIAYLRFFPSPLSVWLL